MTVQELRRHLIPRREVANQRRDAAQQSSESAGDGAIYELDRFEGLLNRRRKGALGFRLPHGVVGARWALVDAGREDHGQATIETQR